jgi:hypothetical protein
MIILFKLLTENVFTGKGASGIMLDLFAFKDKVAALLEQRPGHGPAFTFNDFTGNTGDKNRPCGASCHKTQASNPQVTSTPWHSFNPQDA